MKGWNKSTCPACSCTSSSLRGCGTLYSRLCKTSAHTQYSNTIVINDLKLHFEVFMLPAYISATGIEDKNRPQSCNNQNIMALQKCSFKPNIRQRLHTSTWPIHSNGQKPRSGTIKELNRPSHTDIQKEPLKMYRLFRLKHAFSAACHPNWVNFPPSSLVFSLSLSLSFSLPLFLSPSLPLFLSPSHPSSS